MRIKKLLNLLRNSKNLFRNLWDESPGIQIGSNVDWGVSGSSSKEEDKRLAKKPVDI